jgi:hypothetical protein
MKRSAIRTRAALLTTAVVLVVLGLSTCSNPVGAFLNAKSWGLVGTYVNSAYNPVPPTATYGATLVLGADGTFRTSSSMGTFYGTYTIDSVTVEGAARTFQLQVNAGNPTPSLWRVLARVTDGKTWEAASNIYSNSPYPTAISTSDTTYGKLTVQ